MSSGLMGGEKTRSLFTEYDGAGTRKGGTIVEPFPYRAQQTDFDTGDLLWWDKEETQPKEHIVITLQTDEDEGPDENGFEDTGRRRVYLKGGDLQKRTQLAVRSVGESDFTIGAEYWITRTGYGTPRKNAAGRDLNAPWLHEVEYTLPRPSSGLGANKVETEKVDGGAGGNRQAARRPAARRGGDGGDTVLDRSQARQQAARGRAAQPDPDDEPPF